MLKILSFMERIGVRIAAGARCFSALIIREYLKTV